MTSQFSYHTEKLLELPSLGDTVKSHKLNTQKSLGQHFLFDLNLTSRIARSAGDLKGHIAIEVGPGPGGLTRSLLMHDVEKLIVIERDQRCIPIMKELQNIVGSERLVIINDDAMVVDETALLSAHNPQNLPVRIIANLPYNIGTELVVKWLECKKNWYKTATLMLQKEVVDRIVSSPGSKTYGRLSVLSQLLCNAHSIFDVPPEAFTPPPKVMSAILHLERLDQPRFPADISILSQLTKQSFGQRRKMLRASLKSITADSESFLHAAGIEPTRRPESLSVEEFCKLSNIPLK